jgi:ubiquinone/menaquinone biosynthesis C-methylase UbiE
MAASDKEFTGSVPTIYERYMVPFNFAPYAADMAKRVAALKPREVLEIAAGTGALTVELLRQLPRDTAMIATDLNQAMLDVAATKLPSGAVTLRACDAMQLPFDDHSFDVVACQFGVMFLPDKTAGFRGVRRVLRQGGHFLFSVWDNLDSNVLSAVVETAVAKAFPDDPPAFFRRTPFGYHDEALISSTLRAAGFSDVRAETVTLPSRAPSAEHVAIAICQGTPLRAEIEQRAPGRLAEITDLARQAVAAAHGSGPVEAPMQALVFEAAA